MPLTSKDRVLVWAHRGACAYAPENTMEAFQLAIDMKADGIEIDVHLSKDGRIVVIHDAKIDRTSNGQGAVTEYTLEELKMFDFGYKFYNGERRGIKIPTLDELYELYSKTDMTINIEIKSSDPSIAQKLVELTAKYGMTDKVIYSSFNHYQLLNIHKIDPTIPIAPLYGATIVNVADYASNMNASAVHPNHTLILEDPEYCADFASRGIAVNPWTCNNPEVAKKLADLGANAIITNVPDVMVEALKK